MGGHVVVVALTVPLLLVPGIRLVSWDVHVKQARETSGGSSPEGLKCFAHNKTG